MADVFLKTVNGHEYEIDGVTRVSITRDADGNHVLLLFGPGCIDVHSTYPMDNVDYMTTMGLSDKPTKVCTDLSENEVKTCPECGGVGYTYLSICTECGGKYPS